MYIKINNKKLQINEANTFFERLKGLKFVLGPLTYGIRFPNKKRSNTYFLFEKIDVILTDEDDKILYLFEKVGTEKKIRKRKDVCNTYFVPINTAKNFEVGDILPLVVEKEDLNRRRELKRKKSKKRGD